MDRRQRTAWQTTDRRIGRYWITAPAVLGPPMVIFWLLNAFPRFDITLSSSTWHFVIVTTVSALALVMALAVGWAARHVPDARTFFLALGFLAMSAIFLAHALGSAPAGHEHAGAASAPAVAPASAVAAEIYSYDGAYHDNDHDDDAYHDGYNAATPAQQLLQAPDKADETRLRGMAVGFSGRLSLLISALCFALAALDLRPRMADFIVRHWNALAVLAVAALAGYMTCAVVYPMSLNWIPMTSPNLNWSVAGVTWACLAFAGWRFFQAYRLAALPLQGAMALGMGLLAEAQWFMLRGTIWHLSWWEYHVVMFIGFSAPVLGLLWQYRTAGDLGAIVEGLFLRKQINGVRTGDPDALTALAAAVSAKDGETGAHIERVAGLCVAIGRRLGLPESRLEVLRWAGRLHDLGKIGVPNRILLKPGKLTPAEFKIMQQHTTRGWRVALRSGVLAQAAWLIRAHHERMDGSGYPDGLTGDAIPLEARIIAVADTWDALISDRPYRPSMSYEAAAEIVAREAGTRLDRDCVLALFSELEARSWEDRPLEVVAA